MNGSASGKAFVVGDDIDTDALAPGRFIKAPVEVLAANCLGEVAPEFAGAARPGDVLIAGWNFGIGSSREQAVEALICLGISGVVARSFGGLFYRNAVNLGLPVFTASGLENIQPGDGVRLDWQRARLYHQDAEVLLDPLPDFLVRLISDGGLVPHLARRFQADRGKNE